jgi:hypothetical protein
MEEHQSSADDMGEEEKGFEMAIAKSLVEIQKLVNRQKAKSKLFCNQS